MHFGSYTLNIVPPVISLLTLTRTARRRVAREVGRSRVTQAGGSQLRVILSSWGQLAVYEDIFACHNRGRGVLVACVGEARDVAKNAAVHRTVPTANVSRAEGENPDIRFWSVS